MRMPSGKETLSLLNHSSALSQETFIMALPLHGIKVIDFTGVQAGPACTQMLAWFGAEVLKVERPGVGDVTRRQLRDIPNVDALYFTMLNSNKKSLERNTKTPEGKDRLAVARQSGPMPRISGLGRFQHVVKSSTTRDGTSPCANRAKTSLMADNGWSSTSAFTLPAFGCGYVEFSQDKRLAECLNNGGLHFQ